MDSVEGESHQSVCGVEEECEELHTLQPQVDIGEVCRGGRGEVVCVGPEWCVCVCVCVCVCTCTDRKPAGTPPGGCLAVEALAGGPGSA